MSKSVSNLHVEDFFIQSPIPTQNPKYAEYLRAGIPLWVYGIKADKYQFKGKDKEKVTRYINDLESNILHGHNFVVTSEGTGTGKSTLLFEIAMKSIDLGFRGMCFSFSDLVSLFREIQGSSNTALKIEFKRKVQASDFVIIDDLGGGHVVNKGFVKAEFSDMVSYAETGELHKTALCVSSIIPVNSFSEYLTPSAESRLIDSAESVTLIGNDIRNGGKK